MKIQGFCFGPKHCLDQGFPTHGPRAACGLRGNFVRPARSNAFIHIAELMK